MRLSPSGMVGKTMLVVGRMATLVRQRRRNQRQIVIEMRSVKFDSHDPVKEDLPKKCAGIDLKGTLFIDCGVNIE